MSNYNLTIALTKLKGAKVMEIQGKTCTKTCVVIPIDNEEGTVRDSYEGKIDGLPTTKPLNDVQLHLTAFEFREKKYGQTHGIKASFSKQRMESNYYYMQLRNQGGENLHRAQPFETFTEEDPTSIPKLFIAYPYLRKV